MTVFAISDLHVDSSENRKWLTDLSTQDYQEDVLIVAGDLTDKLELLGSSFAQLSSRFGQVLYVPGNHELWVWRNEDYSSLVKFKMVKELATENGISMQPWRRGPMTIVPLLGWYDYSFGQPEEDLLNRWVDYQACRWEEFGNDLSSVTSFFTRQNEPYLDLSNETVISFSHFVPRIDVMPDYIPPEFQKLYPVLGSILIEKQIRRLKSTIHVYGHSHVNREIEIDGTTYINNAFGMPKETRIAQKGLKCIFEYS